MVDKSGGMCKNCAIRIVVYVKDVTRMKRLPGLLTALCLVLITLSALADFPVATLAPLPGYTLKEQTDDLIIFATMSKKANIAGIISPGQEQDVHALSIDDEWCYVSFLSDGETLYGYLPLSCFEKAPAATPAPAPESPAYETGTLGWVLNSAEGYRLNLREEPSYSAKSLGKYYTGTPFVLTGQVVDGYAEVLLADTVMGWLDIRFITTDAAALVPETPMVTIQNENGGATLRFSPSSSAEKVDYFPHGTLVTVLGVRADGWYHVTADGLTGYVSEALLSGTFPYDYGTDSDNPALTDAMADGTAVFYINTRSADGQLNLRKSASASSKSLGLFYTGTPLTVLSYTRTGWAYVRIGCTEGYVDADYLSAAAPTRYGETRTIRNSRATGLNLRSQPSTGGELLDFAPNYSVITVLGDLSDGWCYVEYNGKLGYMLGDALEKDK